MNSPVTIIDSWDWWESNFHPEIVAIMRECVSQDETRFVLSLPFIRDGRAYATDGRIMVSWAADYPDIGATQKLPDALASLQPHLFDTVKEWRHSSTLAIPAELKEVCGTCGGGQVAECPCCHRDMECEDCYDGSKIDYSKSEIFKGCFFQNRLLRKLGPDFDIGFLDSDLLAAAFIRLPHGGIGRLMPMRKEDQQ